MSDQYFNRDINEVIYFLNTNTVIYIDLIDSTHIHQSLLICNVNLIGKLGIYIQSIINYALINYTWYIIIKLFLRNLSN